MDSKQVVKLFESERPALAMMEHPNIASVLDVGTTDTGLPYFVMELVEGVPITQYGDSRRPLLQLHGDTEKSKFKGNPGSHRGWMLVRPSSYRVSEISSHENHPKALDRTSDMYSWYPYTDCDAPWIVGQTNGESPSWTGGARVLLAKPAIGGTRIRTNDQQQALFTESIRLMDVHSDRSVHAGADRNGLLGLL
jgi:hypothetical protein